MNALRTPIAGLVIFMCAAAANAAGYPEKPIRMIVPFAPGGGSDVSGRIIAAKLGEGLGQQFVIDNRGGAAGTIGAALAAKSDADGYTLLLADTGFSTGISLYAKVGYHPLRDFAPVSLVATTPIVAVVHPAVPAKDMRALIALAKQRPGALTSGSGGTGGSVHLALELFKMQTGTKITHVPYKGSGPAAIDLVGGQIDTMFSTAPPVVPLIKSGKIRALGVASPVRFSILPDVPTMKEAGVPDFIATNWYGIVVPSGTPRAIVDRLHDLTAKATALPEVKQRLAGSGLEPGASASPEAFGKFLSDDVERWAKVIRQANIKVE
jgi:tripartite-type tricarboxylate transporter receptor subunit TctC